MNPYKFRILALCALFLIILPACATVPRQQPAIETKLLEANSALDSVNEQSYAFYAQLGELLQRINQFRAQPGWMEFEQILLEFSSLRDPESAIEITPEIESRLEQWGRRWKTPWEEMLAGYRNLGDRCIVLEAKRLALRERFLAVEAKYLAAAVAELSAGREKQGGEIYSVVELLEKSSDELNSYQTDDLGLYKSR